MHIRNILWFTFGLSTLLLTACSTKQYFTVDSASYQPAIFNESNRTTTIEVIVSDVDTNVVFTDLVFRNLRIPVESEELPGNRVKVTGYIQIGGKLAEDHYQKMTEESNKLYYRVEKNQKSIPLENVERQKTQLP